MMRRVHQSIWAAAGVFCLAIVDSSTAYAYVSNVNQGEPIFFCAAGFIGGIALFVWGFLQLRTKRLMENIPTSTIRAMAPGLVEVSGQAVNWSLFQAPFTREDCVYYQFLVEQLVSSGKSSHWETILKGDSSNFPFYLQDETGTALVCPGGAEVVIPDAYVLKTGMFTDIPGHMDAFLGQNGISCRSLFGFEKTLRFTERRLRPGEPVFVMGTCQETTLGPQNPPTGADPKICLAKGNRSGDVFILSDQSQKELESSFGTKAFLGIFGGIALVGGSVWGLLSFLGTT